MKDGAGQFIGYADGHLVEGDAELLVGGDHDVVQVLVLPRDLEVGAAVAGRAAELGREGGEDLGPQCVERSPSEIRLSDSRSAGDFLTPAIYVRIRRSPPGIEEDTFFSSREC